MVPPSNAPETAAPSGATWCDRSVVDFLQQPGTLATGKSRVEILETHISWLFLTDRFVYKLKKPVQFEFLDFSTSEKRRDACFNELKLNQRLAADVYLEVLPVTSDTRGRLRLDGLGIPVDWVVKMKRLPAQQSLDQLLKQKRLTRNDVERLAATLTKFYERLPPVTIHAAEYLRGIEHHVRANFEELANPVWSFDPWMVKRAHSAQQRFIAIGKEILVDRVRDGRIVDGHGDLRPEHVYFTTTPKIIDCIEFSEELRTVDVADELAFLAMECDRLDANWVGDRIRELYSTVSGDRFAPALFEFFKCYRACVRAKVLALRSRQVFGSEATQLLATAQRYLQLADQFAGRLGSPLMLIVRGLSGTGKSTLAGGLAESLGCRWLQTDEVRQRLFRPSSPEASYGTGNYDDASRNRVYEEVFRLASESLARGESVVLDGTFLSAAHRARAIELAQAHHGVSLLIRCVCPPGLAQERIRERAAENGETVSDAKPEFVELQQALDEPDDPAWTAMNVDTSDGLPWTLQAVYDRLRSMIL